MMPLSPIHTAEADLAYRRIDALLRSHGIDHAALRGYHAHKILTQALADGVPLDTLDIVVAQKVLEEIDRNVSKLEVVIAGVQSGPIDRNRLLLSIEKAHIPHARPDVLLGLGELNAEERQELVRVFKIQPTPDIKRTSMGAPTLRFQAIEVATESAGAVLDHIPFFRRVVLMLTLVAIGYLTYIFAR